MPVVDIYVNKPVPVQDRSSPSCMTLQWLKLRSTRPTAGRSSRSVLKRYCDGGTLP